MESQDCNDCILDVKISEQSRKAGTARDLGHIALYSNRAKDLIQQSDKPAEWSARIEKMRDGTE